MLLLLLSWALLSFILRLFSLVVSVNAVTTNDQVNIFEDKTWIEVRGSRPYLISNVTLWTNRIEFNFARSSMTSEQFIKLLSVLYGNIKNCKDTAPGFPTSIPQLLKDDSLVVEYIGDSDKQLNHMVIIYNGFITQIISTGNVHHRFYCLKKTFMNMFT